MSDNARYVKLLSAAQIVKRDFDSANILGSWHARLRLRILLAANYLLFPFDTRVGVYWPAEYTFPVEHVEDHGVEDC